MHVNETKLQILLMEIHHGRWDWREIPADTVERKYTAVRSTTPYSCQCSYYRMSRMSERRVNIMLDFWDAIPTLVAKYLFNYTCKS
jgi:hypothetical protein